MLPRARNGDIELLVTAWTYPGDEWPYFDFAWLTVLADGFEYAGEVYRSLSAVAKAATGTHLNGFAFFGLAGGAA